MEHALLWIIPWIIPWIIHHFPMAPLVPGHHPRLRAAAIAGGLPGMSCLSEHRLGCWLGWDAGHVGYWWLLPMDFGGGLDVAKFMKWLQATHEFMVISKWCSPPYATGHSTEAPLTAITKAPQRDRIGPAFFRRYGLPPVGYQRGPVAECHWGPADFCRCHKDRVKKSGSHIWKALQG